MNAQNLATLRTQGSLSQDDITMFFRSREPERKSFLENHGWNGAELSLITEDCAFRRYFRVQQDNKTAVLMDGIPDHEGAAAPGHLIGDFIRIAQALSEIGIHVPNIEAVDEQQGLVLMQDFGDRSFQQALNDGESQDHIYALAVDVLRHLRIAMPSNTLDLSQYSDRHVHKGRRRIVEWYMPAVLGRPNPEGLVDDYLSVWDQIEQSLPPCPQGFLHIDYHVENLMLLPGEDGIDACGVLDFQGALWGPLPYDLANLLEDARRTIPADLRESMLARYCAGMDPEEKDTFLAWYRVLATQFHCRVIGQFIKLAVRDDKTKYLNHIPRLEHYLKEAMSHPLLHDLGAWFDENGIDFHETSLSDPDKIRPFIHSDAF